MHGSGIEDLDGTRHGDFRKVRVGAVEFVANHDAAVDVAYSLLVGLGPSSDGISVKRVFRDVVVLDGIEMLVVHRYALVGISGMETLHLLVSLLAPNKV